MALRTIKITREIILNNHKYLSSKAEIIAPISSNKGTEVTEHEVEVERHSDSPSFRYIVSNTKKPNVLPKIEFPKQPEELIPPEMRHLQPSMLPKFMELRDEKKEVEWEPSATDNKELDPFPEPIRELRTKTLTISDQKKAELKSPSINVNFKNNNFSIINRSYSTSPYFIVSRTLAKTSKKGNEKCEEKEKKRCQKSGCPSFTMKNCPPVIKSDCMKRYTDLKCTKKLAPYPSYSESCAERLEDDPSECMQCPWQKCGGVESIKPPKRNYHTSHRNLTSIPVFSPNHVNFMPFKECDAKKEPCKRPPGKCDKKEEKKKEKCPEKKKKCANWASAYRFWNAKENILPIDGWQDVASSHDIQSDRMKKELNCAGDCKKIVFALVIGVCLAQPQRRPHSDIDESQNADIQQYQEPRGKHESTTFIPIIRFDKEQGEDGSYKASYETGNNIFAEEEGYLKNLGPDPDAEGETLNAQVQQGSYSYTAPDGTIITVKYTADESGFHPSGDHLPTPPPVSPEVQKGLELIYAGIRAQEEADARDAKENPQAVRKIPEDYNGQYRP